MMQTFLPYPSFTESANVLDHQRLGKQRIEGLQILRVLCGESDGWRHHPAVRMWKGHELSLYCYTYTMFNEWMMRGYKAGRSFENLLTCFNQHHSNWGTSDPPWLGDPDFHLSHRSNLLRKDPNHYRQFWPDDPDDLPYVWPVGRDRG